MELSLELKNRKIVLQSFRRITFGFVCLDNGIFSKPADHIKCKSFAIRKKHNRLIPKIFRTVVLIEPYYTVASPPNINLSDFIIAAFIDKVINSGPLRAGYFLCFSK